MTGRITTAEVAHVARLARLELTDDELETFTGQLAAVLDHAADVEALDVATCRRPSHPYPLKNVLRPDVVGATVDTATRCWPPRRWSRTAASGCRRSSARRPDVVVPVGPRAGGRRAGRRVVGRVRARGVPRRDRGQPTATCTPSTSSPRTRRGRPPAVVDEAVAAGRDPGPLAGVPVALKDNLCTHGVADHLLVADPRGVASRPTTRPWCERLQRRGRRHHRQDEPRRVRHGQLDRELRLRADPQPARPHARCRAGRRAAAPRRWRPASRRSPSGPTPAARSASRPRCAASSA